MRGIGSIKGILVLIFGILVLSLLSFDVIGEDKVANDSVISEELVAKINNNPEEIQRIIIIFDEKPENYRNFLKSLGGKIKYEYKLINGAAISLPGKNIVSLAGLSGIKKIEEDIEVHAFLSETVPLINANDVWGLGYDGYGIKVCVVDTGIDYTHSALGGCFGEGCKVIGGYDFVNSDNNPVDDEGHGTHVAGIIASDDSIYKGVAPKASLMAVKVLNQFGAGLLTDVIAGIQWCVENNVDIVSLSLGTSTKAFGYCDSEAGAQAINNAVNAGVVSVVASGNEGWTNGISAPFACASKAISVGATYDANVGSMYYSEICSDSTTYADKIACFTNRNNILDLLAPGSLIKSAKLGGGFVDNSGTSMATPHVSGVAALLLQKIPLLTPAETESNLKSSNVQIYDSATGLTFPRVDALLLFSLPCFQDSDCGVDSYSGNYCYDNDVYRDFSDKGCGKGECFSTTTKQLVQDCGNIGCSNGKCRSGIWLISPENEKKLSMPKPQPFKWGASMGYYEFRVEISRQPDFKEDKIRLKKVKYQQSYSPSNKELNRIMELIIKDNKKDDGVLYWRVEGKKGKIKKYSDVHSFY